MNNETDTSSLYILRHAEAAPSGAGGDFMRPLTAQGRAQAAALAAEMAGAAALDRVWVSSARRTTETAAIVTRDWGRAARMRSERLFYEASVNTWLKCLRGGDLAANERVLLVGHNPAVSMLASVLVGKMLPLSPCTLLELRFACPWSELSDGCCQLAFSHSSSR